ncbi:MAG: putative sporulation protein YtxC [Clostridiales bacterium]|nr:putative sporulation protein YtxC [Clostridiales bacterium]
MEKTTVIWDNEMLAGAFFLSVCQAEPAAKAGFRQGRREVCVGNAPSLPRLLSGFFFSRREEWLLWQLAACKLECFGPSERERIRKRAKELLEVDNLVWGMFAGLGRERRLEEAFRAELTERGCLNVAGFERFRMAGYAEYLLAVLSVAADELLGEQEDKAYLSLLQSFMRERPGRFERVCLDLKKGGSYSILAESGHGLLPLEGGRGTGFEDMIISSLLSLSPQKLLVHMGWEKTEGGFLLNALNDIFAGCLILCREEPSKGV